MQLKNYFVFGVLILIIVSIGCLGGDNSGDSGEVKDLKKELEVTKQQLIETQNSICSPSRIPVQTAPPDSTTPVTTTSPPVISDSNDTTLPTLMWYEGLSAYEINSRAERISYEDLVRKIEQYNESIVTFKGEIYKIWGNYDGPYGVTIYTKTNSVGTYNAEPIYLSDYDFDPRLIKGDVINFWGVPDGFFTENDAQTTVPQLIPLQAIVEE